MIPILTKTAKKVMTNKYVMTTIISIVAFFLLKGTVKKLIRKYRASRFDKNETQDVNQIAQQYRAAANPSSISWLIDADGTDEEAVERLGYQSKGNLESITSAYKQKFDETLTDRMRKELSPNEFQEWKNIID